MNIYKMAYHYMNKHGLYDWKFKLHDKIIKGETRVLGYCQSSEKIISLDSFVAKSVIYRDVRSIILHEIAHALANEIDPTHDHDSSCWKNIVQEIGSHHCEAVATEPLKLSSTERNCDNIHVLEFMKYHSNVDELCFMLKKRYGHGTEYWYGEYLKILQK